MPIKFDVFEVSFNLQLSPSVLSFPDNLPIKNPGWSCFQQYGFDRLQISG